MKKIFNLILVATTLFVFSNAYAQEKYLPVSETPGQIASYVKVYAPPDQVRELLKLGTARMWSLPNKDPTRAAPSPHSVLTLGSSTA